MCGLPCTREWEDTYGIWPAQKRVCPRKWVTTFLFLMHNGSLVTSAQYGSEDKQTDKFFETRWISQTPNCTRGVSWLHTQHNCFLSIMQQMVLEMIWKALKRERHMQRNSGDRNQRIYSWEQSGVSDYVITLSLLMRLNRDAEASCSTHSSSLMQNHQPHILTRNNRKCLTLLLNSSYSLIAFKRSLFLNSSHFFSLKPKVATICSLEFSGSIGQIIPWKTALPSMTSKARKINAKISLQALTSGLRLCWRAGEEGQCNTLPDAVHHCKSFQTHVPNSSFHSLIFLNFQTVCSRITYTIIN